MAPSVSSCRNKASLSHSPETHNSTMQTFRGPDPRSRAVQVQQANDLDSTRELLHAIYHSYSLSMSKAQFSIQEYFYIKYYFKWPLMKETRVIMTPRISTSHKGSLKLAYKTADNVSYIQFQSTDVMEHDFSLDIQNFLTDDGAFARTEGLPATFFPSQEELEEPHVAFP